MEKMKFTKGFSIPKKIWMLTMDRLQPNIEKIVFIVCKFMVEYNSLFTNLLRPRDN